MEHVFTACVMGRYEAKYFRSPESGLISVQDPTWLEEAYQSAITELDVGLVQRNLHMQQRTVVALKLIGETNGPYLDYGGGYGLFTRLMRDAGYDFFWSDRYCENLFAKLHEAPKAFRPRVITAFELFEHIPDPVAFLSSLLEQYGCHNLVFSTLTYDGSATPPRDWWYYTFETGQHISFYSAQTLTMLAEKFGCRYIPLGNDLHIFTPKRVSKLRRKLFLNRFSSRLLRQRERRRRRALTWSDFEFARESLRKRQGTESSFSKREMR